MKVEPIRDKKKVEDIKKFLSGDIRNYCLFVCGINNGLRAGDLLKIKVGQIKDLKTGDKVRIKEEKTKKENYFYINKPVYQAIQRLIQEYDLSNDDYLFQSRKQKGKLDTYTLNRLVKSWCKSVGLSGNYGSHTLRKTWGYIQRVYFGVSWELISERFNHSNPSQTRVYLGIDKSEISKIMTNEI